MSDPVIELRYEVSFKGAASDVLRSAFDDCLLDIAPGRTVVSCAPAVLHDVLDRLQSFGLELLDVRLVAAPPDAVGSLDVRRSDEPGGTPG